MIDFLVDILAIFGLCIAVWALFTGVYAAAFVIVDWFRSRR